MEYNFKAEDIINSNRVTKEDLKEIRSWVDSLGAKQIPNELLILALIACKNNLDNTKNTISAYFKAQNSAPEMYNNCSIDEPGIQTSIDTMLVAIMPTRTEDNQIVLMHELHDQSYNKFNHLSHLRRIALTLHLLMNSSCPPNGLIIVYDMRKFSLSLVPKLNPKHLMRFFNFIQNGLLIEVQQVHLMNSGFVLQQLIRIIKLCVPAALFSKLICHDSDINTKEFYDKYVPAKCLPKEYGGLLPPLEELHQQTLQDLRKNQVYYEEDQKLRESCKEYF